MLLFLDRKPLSRFALLSAPLLTVLLTALLTLCLCGMLFPTAAFGQTPGHAYINQTRSSTTTNLFVGIGAEGEFGELTSSEKIEVESKDGELVEENIKAKWQGYSVRNEVGLELRKFLQFSLGHNSVNLRNSKDSSENMSGSRVNAGMALAFYAPLGNLRFGGGFLGSRMDYRRSSKSTTYYGSGYYYDVGFNYFFSYRVSFYVTGKRNFENFVRTNGSELAKNMQSETTAAGCGFKLWL